MGIVNFLDESGLLETLGYGNTFMGGTGAALQSSGSAILNTLYAYEAALKEYEQLKGHGAAPYTRTLANQRAQAAFHQLDHLLKSKGMNAIRNTPVKTRMTTTATGRPAVESIPLSDHGDVRRLEKFAKMARVVGPGLIILDGALRVNNVRQAYREDREEWQKLAVQQSAGFVAGVIGGLLIGLVVVALPVGLVGGILFGGLAAIGIDEGVKKIVGDIYDGFTK